MNEISHFCIKLIQCFQTIKSFKKKIILDIKPLFSDTVPYIDIDTKLHSGQIPFKCHHTFLSYSVTNKQTKRTVLDKITI